MKKIREYISYFYLQSRGLALAGDAMRAGLASKYIANDRNIGDVVKLLETDDMDVYTRSMLIALLAELTNHNSSLREGLIEEQPATPFSKAFEFPKQ